MKLPSVPIPVFARTLPLVSVTLAVVWLLAAVVVGIGFRGDLASADAELREVARQVIHQPELEIPQRLLPVARDLMPGFDSNEMFSFLRKEGGDDGAQERFEVRAAEALARFDAHPTRVLGLVPAQPAVHALLSHTLLHASVIQALLTMLIFLLAAPVLERLWGWRVFLPFAVLVSLAGAGAYLLVHHGGDRALLGGGALVAGVVSAFLVRFGREEVDFLRWLPASASLELLAPAWLLGVVWGIYELVAWLSMPMSVPGLAPSSGFAAHAGGALAGALAALAVHRLGWETERPEPKPKPAPPQRFDVARIQAMVQAGQGDEALAALEAVVSRNARHRDAVTLYFKLCRERGRAERAAPALAQLVREELRRGAEDVAVARWRDLVTHVPDARMDPATLVRIATLLSQEGDDETAAIALQNVTESKGVPSSIAAEAARVASGFSRELATKAARVALADDALDARVRGELEALTGSGPAAEPKDEGARVAPAAPAAKELPPNVFYEGQDRSSFGELADLGAVEDFPAGAVTQGVLRSLDLEGFVVHSDEHGEARIDHGRVRAVAVVGVHGLGPKPVLLIDVVLDGSGTPRPLSAYRLRSDRFDPRRLAPGANGGIEALRSIVGQLLAGSEALPLPDAQAAVLRPPKIYESLATYEREVLTPLGHQLS